MNSPRFSPLFAILLVVLSFGGIKAQAQMFGGSYQIGDTTYQYVTSIDEGTYQTDVYNDGNAGSIFLRGRIGASVTLAEVSGAFEGYFDGGFHPMSVVTSSISSVNLTSPDGRQYNEMFDRIDATMNLESDTLEVADRTIYRGSAGEFSIPRNGVDGEVRGAETGWVYQGGMLLNSSGSTTWPTGTGSPVNLFGEVYRKVSASFSSTYESNGDNSNSSHTTYQSSSGGSFSHETWTNPNESSSTMSGNDPYVGNWSASGDFSSLGFEVLQSPKFAPQVFMVNGTLVHWTESVINNSAGNVTAIFSGGGVEVTINGNVRSFVVDQTAATMTVDLGGHHVTGTISKTGAVSGFDPAVCHIQTVGITRTTPLFTGTKLYIDNVPYPFAGGYEDSAGHRIDQYEHDGLLIQLVGTTSSPSTATVRFGASTGTFASGLFTVPDCVIVTTLVEGPPAFWVHGVLYTKVSGAYQSAATTPQRFHVSGEVMSDLSLSGTISGSTLTGTYNAEQSGVFNVTLGGTSRLACPAEASGELIEGPALNTLNGTSYPHPELAGLPAAVRIPVTIPIGTETLRLDVALDFLGIATDDDASGDWVACYGNSFASPPPGSAGTYWTQNLHLLKIRASTSSSKTVTLRDYKGAKTSDGTYNIDSRLFQAELKPSNATIKALPFSVMSLEPANNYAFWFVDAPAGGLPRSFIIRGQPWWYAGEVGGKQVYRGFYTEQEMTLPVTADANGQRLVKLKDYAFDINGNLTPGTTNETQGTLSGVRSSIRFRDNTLALSGTEGGTQQAVTVADDFTLHTIRSDVDIIGNNLSFGIINHDASLAGALFRFEDSGTLTSPDGKSRLSTIMSRKRTEWGWFKQHESNLEALRPVMFIGEDHILQLYPPVPSNYPGVVLNPSGISSFKGPVRVPAGGDVPMGVFQEGIAP